MLFHHLHHMGLWKPTSNSKVFALHLHKHVSLSKIPSRLPLNSVRAKILSPYRDKNELHWSSREPWKKTSIIPQVLQVQGVSICWRCANESEGNLQRFGEGINTSQNSIDRSIDLVKTNQDAAVSCLNMLALLTPMVAHHQARASIEFFLNPEINCPVLLKLRSPLFCSHAMNWFVSFSFLPDHLY